MAYKYPIIYWNTANLIVDSGSVDEESNDSTNYGKMGSAIANIQQEDVHIAFPLINTAGFGFKPDLENDQIIFGLKGINGINTDISHIIIQNRPYANIEEFCEKLIDTKIIKPNQMIKLIKAGCFTELHSKDRDQTLEWYIKKYLYEPVQRLTLAQLGKMKERHLIPTEFKKVIQVLSLKNYILDDEGLYELFIDPDKQPLKRGYHDRYFILDNQAQSHYASFFTEAPIVKVINEHYVVSEKLLIREVETYLKPFREWFSSADAINKYNWNLFLESWEKHAAGTPGKWSMEALCYYDGEHELEHANEQQYGIVNFFKLPTEPEPYEWYTRKINGEYKNMPKYKIVRIAGTVLHADNFHHTVTLLTKYGPVLVKLNKGHYAFYGKQISRIEEDGSKTTLEKSWLTRGNLLLISGIRRDDQFWPMIYNDTIYKHTINLIKQVQKDGTLELQVERTKV